MPHRRMLLHLLLAAAILAGGTSIASAAARIVIINANEPNVGFNDPTPATPVGGNPGTTLGQQRLLAFERAAELWGAELDSSVEIRIRAAFEPLPCTATSAVLGAAGATGFFVGVPGSGLFPGTAANVFHPSALADKVSGVNVWDVYFGQPTAPDINARFNSEIGKPGCLATRGWYLGFDANEGTNIDLVAVLLHEFGHGLGFIQLAGPTGALPANTPDVFNRYIFDNTANESWLTMTDAERAASMINPRNVVFAGPEATAAVPLVLRPTPVLRITAPAAIAGDYPVGTAAFGAPLTDAGITGTIVQGLDAANADGPLTTDGCSPLSNAAAVAGNIVLLDRGTCGFAVKAANAQAAGARAAIIANNAAGPAPGLGGVDPTITIPVASVSQADGDIIKGGLASGVAAFLGLDLTRRAGADSLGRPLLYTPNPYEPGSSVSHFDTIANPNQLMEPFINSSLTHNLKPPFDLTLPVMRDIGWYPDADLDGLADSLDACPSASDQRATVFVGDTNTGVANVVFTNGCSIGDLVALIEADAKNHGRFVSGVAHLTNALRNAAIITEEDKAAIRTAAAHTKH